ncbi:MORN repeat-containing protein [Lacisediminimonas profundi]|uniref:MORN repeat-containing protein n=1 Tax=Lacisediminimonas profundi TaxID=2603856 RepID=UPI0019D5317A|nr:hypothetical protein [Lacisediminimonas profundi]
MFAALAFTTLPAPAQVSGTVEGEREYPLSHKGQLTGTKARYKGELLNGKRHGRGTMMFDHPDGGQELYVGEWRDDQKHGQAVLQVRDYTYSGQFENGVRQGKGAETFADGTTFEGEFVNGKRHGFGMMRYANGVVHEGNWAEGQFHGFGLRAYANGTVHAEYYLTGVKALSSFDISKIAQRPLGCNGQFQDWVVYSGVCTKQGLKMGKNGPSAALMHPETFDWHTIVGTQGWFTMFQQGVVIEGSLRAPFDFTTAKVMRPVLRADGKSVDMQAQYIGPMRGLLMHGRGKCAKPGGGMENCTMKDGERVDD